MPSRFYCYLIMLFSMMPNVSIAAETQMVEMKTSAGDVRIEIYTETAPITAANFLKYVDGKHYDNKGSIYRTVRMDNQAQNKIKIEVIQGGLGMYAPNLPFPAIAHETTEMTGILHKDGVISMGRIEPGTATSEFFICINDQPELDFAGKRYPDGLGFAPFGKVVKGMDIIRIIQDMKTDMPKGAAKLEYTTGQMLVKPVEIYSISRVK